MSGIFTKFAQKANSKITNGKSRKPYTLDECLAIIDMIDSGESKETIIELTGRDKASLNSKFFEGQVTIKGRTQVRSIQKHWYKDPTDPNSEKVDTESALIGLYKSFKLTYPEGESGIKDIESRIDSWKQEMFKDDPIENVS